MRFFSQRQTLRFAVLVLATAPLLQCNRDEGATEAAEGKDRAESKRSRQVSPASTGSRHESGRSLLVKIPKGFVKEGERLDMDAYRDKVFGLKGQLKGVSSGALCDELKHMSPSDLSTLDGRLTASAIFLELAGRDASAFFEALAENRGLVDEGAAFIGIGELARKNPEAVLKYLASKGEDVDFIVLQAAGNYCGDAMVGYLASLTGNRRKDALQAYFSVMADKDLPGALRAIRNAPLTSAEKDSLLKTAVYSGETTDWANRLDAVKGVGSKDAQTKLLSVILKEVTADGAKLMEGLGAVDPEVAWNALQYRPEEIASIAGASPDALKKIIDAIPLTASRKDSITKAAEAMATKDYGGTLAWLSGWEDSPVRDELIAKAAATFPTDGSATDLLKTAESYDGVVRERILAGAAGRVGAGGMERIEEFAKGLPEGDRKVFLDSAIVAGANFHPEQLARFVVESPEFDSLSPEARAKAGEGVAAAFASRGEDGLAQAREWYDQVGDEGVKVAATRGIVSRWLKYGPVDVSNWLSGLQAGPARDAGIKLLISDIEGTDPERAAQWREMLSNPMR